MTDDYYYIGDGVYALYDGFGINLRANSVTHPTDEIYLELPVFHALKIYEGKMFERTLKKRASNDNP